MVKYKKKGQNNKIYGNNIVMKYPCMLLSILILTIALIFPIIDGFSSSIGEHGRRAHRRRRGNIPSGPTPIQLPSGAPSFNITLS
jgi:hypothetical protein